MIRWSPDPAARVARLLATWRASHYDIALPDGAIGTLRIGQVAPPAVQAWQRPDPVTAFISAGNPHAKPLTPMENSLRHEALRSALRGWPCRLLPGIGHVPGGAWREHALFVSGLDLATLDAFAREFDQDAIVTLPAGGAACLRVYRSEWRALSVDETHLDWVT